MLAQIFKSGLKVVVGPPQNTTLRGVLNFRENRSEVAGNWPNDGKLGLGRVLRMPGIPKSVGSGPCGHSVVVCQPEIEN